MKIRSTLSAMALAFLILGCKPGVPSEFISPSDMEDIIYDYCLAQGVIAGNKTQYQDKKRDLYSYKKEILEKHGYTLAEYDSSMVYYMSHAKRLYEVYENVSERLGNDAVAMGAAASDLDKFGAVDATGDTTNVWNERSTVVLSHFPPYNKLNFSIKADTTYKEGDKMLLDFDNRFIYQDGSKSGIAMLSVCYDNDSVVSRRTYISSTMNYTVEIPSCKGHKIKSIKGFFYHTKKLDASLTTLKLMVLNNIRLIRFHEKVKNDTIPGIKDSKVIKDLRNNDSVKTNAK